MNGVKLLKELSNEELIRTITHCYSKRDILKYYNINTINSTALKYISSFIKDNNVNKKVLEKTLNLKILEVPKG